MRRWTISLIGLSLFCALAAAGEAEEIRISSALVKVLDEADVSATQIGVIAQTVVREGQQVEAGDVLLKVDDEEARLAKARAQQELRVAEQQVPTAAEVKAAQQEMEVAGADRQRADRSRQKFSGSVTQSEYDHLVLDVALAKAKLERIIREREVAMASVALRQHDVELADLQLRRHTLRSPLGGVAVDLERRLGEWVKPGEKILRVIRMDRLKVEFFVNVQRVGNLEGARAKFTLRRADRPPLTTEGTITFVSPVADPVSGEVRVSAEVPNTELHLRPGMKVTVLVTTKD